MLNDFKYDIKNDLMAASAISLENNWITLIFVESQNRATPFMFRESKLSLLLYKTFNSQVPFDV
jgi:hypothetical protein